MRVPAKPAANRPAWVLACSLAVVLGTVGALNFLDGNDEPAFRAGAPARIAQAPLDARAAPEPRLEEREHLRQYALAMERALVSSDPRQRDTAFAMLLPELLAAEPAAVVEIFARQAPGESRDALREEIARRWVVMDDESASSWIASLIVDDRRAAALTAMRTLAASSPERAIAIADRFGVGRDDGSLEHLAQIWAEQDIEAAQRWAEGQAGDSGNAPLRERIAQVAGRKGLATR